MPTDDKSKKPIPSAAEINAYLELSAARTKKRLTLAAGNAAPLKGGGAPDRKLRLTGSAGDARERPATAASVLPASVVVDRGAGSPSGGADELAWSPFSKDPKS